ncbi:MAG: glyoxalase-like domain protein, partial [Cyanobacteria bacterium P01_H01_bin.15]
MIFAAFFGLPLDSLFSTQGIMVLLLAAYAIAMWAFLKNAPTVYTVMVSDLGIAQDFYEGVLRLAAADIPLSYYNTYEQTLGASAMDPIYFSTAPELRTRTTQVDGLWYQLRKNTQLHIIPGATLGSRHQQRHVCFDGDCLEQILLKVQSRRLKY